jgi:protein-disulfide isomerase
MCDQTSLVDSGGRFYDPLAFLYLGPKEVVLSRFPLFIVIFSALLWTPPAAAEIASLAESSDEMVMGDENAPVTIIEYSSLSCPHCASFHKNTLPQVQEKYIDTGKVRLVYRDYPLGALALAAAMVARCGGKDKYFGLIDILFLQQERWAKSNSPLEEITRIVRFGGISGQDVEACLDSTGLMKAIQARAKEGQELFAIRSTPTFVIEGKVVPGALPFSAIDGIISEALANKSEK